MRVCLNQKQFAEEIKLLHYMTKELSALTGMCSMDDEDCLEVVPTTTYYNLNAIDLSQVELVETTASPDEEIEVSGSGEGFPVDDDDDVCSVNPTVPEISKTESGVNVGSSTDSVNVQNTSASKRGASLPSSAAVIALTVVALAWGHLTSS